MARASKVDRMPPEIRELVATLRQTHGWTIDQILAALRDLAAGRQPRLPRSLPPELAIPPGLDPDLLPHRSKLGAHIKGLDQLAAKLHKTRAIAEALVRKTGAEESRLTQLNVELMHSVVTDLVMAAEAGELAPADPDGESGTLPIPVLQDPAKVMFLAKALDHLASARKKDVDAILKVREETERKTKAAAIKATESMAREAGLSRDTIAAIKATILGVKVPS